jgi:VWFA-related protein
MISQRPFFKTSLPGLSRRSLTCLLVMTGVFLQMAATQSQGNKETQKKQDETVRLETRLITLDVIVKDKKGKYVTDLRAEDFSVFEETASDNEPANIISLVLDGVTTDPANSKQAQEGIIKYLRERITGADTVAVFGIANDLQLLQPFTRDKAKLIAAVEKGVSFPTSNKNLERGQLADGITETRDKLDRLGGADAPQSSSAGAGAAADGSNRIEAMIANRALEQFTLLRSQLSVQQARPVMAALAAYHRLRRPQARISALHVSYPVRAACQRLRPG